MILDAIEDCFRPEITIVSGLTPGEIDREIRRLAEFNRSLDLFLYGEGCEEAFVEEIREILDEPIDDFIANANANLELLWHG